MAERYVTGPKRKAALDAILRAERERVRAGARSPQPNGADGEEQQAPEAYLARTPPDGIPACEVGTTGTGTAANSDPLDDAPGVAYCDVYRTADDAAGRYPVPVTGLAAKVYNWSPDAVAGDQWVIVVRDKFGQWQLAGAAGGGGTTGDSRIVDFVHVIDLGTTGTGSPPTDLGWACERVTLGSSWPPVADPSVQYTAVVESENREPRIRDASGSASHIIPLYRCPRSGGYFIQFWATDTSDEWQDVVAWTITEDTETCVITATPTYRTLRATISVTPPGTTETGLTLTVEEV